MTTVMFCFNAVKAHAIFPLVGWCLALGVLVATDDAVVVVVVTEG